MNARFGEELPELSSQAGGAGPVTAAVAASIGYSSQLPDAVLRIPVAIQVVIGSARLPLSQVTQLGPGSVIALEQKLGAPAIILVNGREVARGELFVLDAENDRLGITITDVTGNTNSAAL